MLHFKQLIVDEENKRTTLIAEAEVSAGAKLMTSVMGEKLNNREVFSVKCSTEDSFDPYVGAALALAEAQFGSKSKFKKWVDQNSTYVMSKEEKKAAKQLRKARAKAKLK